MQSDEVFSEKEPTVSQEIIQEFSARLQSIEHYSQLRQMNRNFINIHVNTSNYDELEKQNGKKARINTSTNVRAAFDYIAQWAKNSLSDADVRLDYRLLVLTVIHSNQMTRIAVKMGCTNLGHSDANGEWTILPNIDYVLYCFDINLDQSILEQFHLFTKEDFLQMWRDISSIRVYISTSEHNRLRALYGPDFKFNQDEHADSMIVQVFKTSRKKTKLFEERFSQYPSLTLELLQKLVIPSVKENNQ